ncbi:hypothetical protein DERP_014800 [Dermatophagoides pteronyssinus]|uniref:Uncharacterized protein n=1 Tax=Dermatophagoides pteronyssinus TaxID=6956 RepID=A0ABQ8J2F9_DERPT|nr:hypothetical protein DERP_014800 [Dermatophagoides pteronyssinus]
MNFINNPNDDESLNKVEVIDMETPETNEDFVINMEQNSNHDEEKQEYDNDDNCCLNFFYKIFNFWLFLINMFELVLIETLVDFCFTDDEDESLIKAISNINRKIQLPNNENEPKK